MTELSGATGTWVRHRNAIVLTGPTGTQHELELEGAPAAGQGVRWVQEALNIVLGRGLAVDGVAGPQTRGAILDFQRAKGLAAAGVAGPATAGALRAALLTLASGGAPCAGVGRPAEELVGFAFNDHRLQPRHLVQSGKLARCSAASQATRVRIVGHTDPVGDDSYNLTLGLRRADEVAKAMREALDRQSPGASERIHFDVDTRGEAEQIPGLPEQSRRVQVFVPLAGPSGPKARPRPARPKPGPKTKPRPSRPGPPSPPLPKSTFARATTVRAYIDLLLEAERRLTAAGFTQVDDRIQILSGVYYGTGWSRDFKTESSSARNVAFQVYTGRSGPGPDPRPILGSSLFTALRASQDVRADAPIGPVDVGHVMIGLNARASVLARKISIPTQGATGLEIVTWVGDLGGATGRVARDRVSIPKTPASKYFTGSRGGDYGADSNLEGDVAAYVLASGTGAVTLQALTIPAGSTIADAFAAYFLSPAAVAPRARQFLQMYGSFVVGSTLINRRAIETAMADSFRDFGLWYVGTRYGPAAALSASPNIGTAASDVARLFVDWLVARLPASPLTPGTGKKAKP